MLEHKKILKLDDFFTDLNQRREKCVYVYRINGWNEDVKVFIRKYYDMARHNGVVLEGGIPNPTSQNFSYYQEMMGSAFQMQQDFMQANLHRWLPRMNPQQCQTVAVSIYSTLDNLRKNGKPESVLKNTYIKFMCWLYYKFERIVGQLGNPQLPKILYEGDISNHELLLLSVLAHAGSDVIILQYHGDAGYLKLDANSQMSDKFVASDMKDFPENFSLHQLRQEMQAEVNQRRLYGTLPEISNCTNAWITGASFTDIRKNPAERGQDGKLFYNLYSRVEGVEEKQTYQSHLYQLYSDLKSAGRRIVILENALPQPSAAEVAEIRRKNVMKTDDLIMDLQSNITYPANLQLERLMIKSFVDVMLEESKKPDMTLHQLSNHAILLLCWLKRWEQELFHNWKMPDIGCIIYLGGCKNEKEAMFFKFMSKLPVDILILLPDFQQTCCLEDKWLYEQHFENSLAVTHFPKDISEIRVGTTAYHAERELDTILYQDSGIYRNQQYHKADAITLRTTYEEIMLYWKEEVSMRPNFEIVNHTVNIPVLFAKVCGVKDGNTADYLTTLKMLMTDEPFIIQRAPFISSMAMNPIKVSVTEFLKNQKLQRDSIRNHRNYAYGFLREEIQEHILDKLQLLLDQRIIRGTYENGTEYTIIATILHLPVEIIRKIQKFDFTKKNPKLVYIIAGEQMISLEDTIMTAFLNLVGFDIVFFVPTGYQCIEKHFQKLMIDEHQIGEYVYDLRVPDLRRYSGKPVKSNPFKKVFKKK